jgi:hypothetical protein
MEDKVDFVDNDDSDNHNIALQIVLSDSNDKDNILGGDFNLLMLFIATIYNNERDSYYARDRLDWDRHVQELVNEKAFSRVYWMSLISFNELCVFLDPLLKVDPEMSKLRTKKGPIDTQIFISSFIRWVSGGLYHDAQQVTGVSVASFYRVMMRCAKTTLAIRGLSNVQRMT